MDANKAEASVYPFCERPRSPLVAKSCNLDGMYQHHIHIPVGPYAYAKEGVVASDLAFSTVRTPPPGNRLVRTEGVSSTANGVYDCTTISDIRSLTDTPYARTMRVGRVAILNRPQRTKVSYH
jgi:hypothetical protein